MKYSFDAVIFDMDGVVTKTARIHSKAWKIIFDEYLRLRERRNGEPFREFTENDYLTYVDGKPRYKGVKSFLESRGIRLPFGHPSNNPDKETICGIGNKKNEKFLELLKTEGIEIYDSTIALIRELRKNGIRTGIISSSKSCEFIIQSAGVEDLFDTRVDGIVSKELGLKGKPNPDVFIVTTRNLETTAARSVIVEDALSGVKAGRNGGFGLVIGIARKNNEGELIRGGADVVVNDLSEMDIEWIERWFHRKPRKFLDSWHKKDRVSATAGKEESPTGYRLVHPFYFRNSKRALFCGKKLVFFLDYDGTLTPIVARPDLAVLSGQMRAVVKRLSEKYTVAIVSGRMRQDVQKLVGIEGLVYAGSHGFDIQGPGISMVEPHAKELIPLISQVIEELHKKVGKIGGVLVEEKKFSVAVHYRLVEAKYLPSIKEAVEDIVSREKELRLMQGKKVFEILPAFEWDKGKAIVWIMKALGLSWSNSSIVYIGDDTTDEDAFRVLRTRGTGILVSSEPRPSAADFWVSSPVEVERIFREILSL